MPSVGFVYLTGDQIRCVSHHYPHRCHKRKSLLPKVVQCVQHPDTIVCNCVIHGTGTPVKTECTQEECYAIFDIDDLARKRDTDIKNLLIVTVLMLILCIVYVCRRRRRSMQDDI